MTVEEALKILDTIPTIGEQVDALEMAIRSLEAWEKVKAEIEEAYTIFGFISWRKVDLLHIIDKHLKEVENADSN